jgi:hypothetical protein
MKVQRINLLPPPEPSRIWWWINGLLAVVLVILIAERWGAQTAPDDELLSPRVRQLNGQQVQVLQAAPQASAASDVAKQEKPPHWSKVLNAVELTSVKGVELQMLKFDAESGALELELTAESVARVMQYSEKLSTHLNKQCVARSVIHENGSGNFKALVYCNKE